MITRKGCQLYQDYSPYTRFLKNPQHHIYIVVSGDVYNNFVAPVFFGDSGDDNGTKLGIWGFSEGLW